jgi:hypothetical protein
MHISTVAVFWSSLSSLFNISVLVCPKNYDNFSAITRLPYLSKASEITFVSILVEEL